MLLTREHLFNKKYASWYPVAEFLRHGDIVAEKKLSFPERFVHKV